MPRISLRNFLSTEHGSGKGLHWLLCCNSGTEHPTEQLQLGSKLKRKHFVTAEKEQWLKWFGGGRARSSLLLHLCRSRKAGGVKRRFTITLKLYRYDPNFTRLISCPKGPITRWGPDCSRISLWGIFYIQTLKATLYQKQQYSPAGPLFHSCVQATSIVYLTKSVRRLKCALLIKHESRGYYLCHIKVFLQCFFQPTPSDQ